ncbi:MAG: mechanosensitive ion channel family protein [Rhodanobacter sp.]|nr:MAG: mechanosensitive ion channel family protein [Rhodanobacter sp.]TAM02874.1 MAG: mechanosensitive ion channel family protein [Rhodanobacter sp.]TAM39056.1 MAG: mechanosensitive ion channel family protein [Rhodanobacter sp.]TAN27666.1 MAG: mechanosensitive ion channel family protein [Rhodanobacter sp.]
MPALLRRLVFVLLCLGSFALPAQDSDSVPAAALSAATPAQALDQLDNRLDSLKAELKNKHPTTPLADLRNAALEVQDQARQLAGSLTPQMAALQAQLAVLGPPPAKGSPPEAPEVAAQRRQLDKAQVALDAQIKQAQLLSQSALQLAAQLTGLRNDEFQARLASRTASPFTHAFWADPVRTFPDDIVRLNRLDARSADAWRTAWQPPNQKPLLACLIGAALLLGVGRWLLDRLLLSLATRHVPDGHLRRSAMAVAVALTAVFTTGLAAQLVYVGLNWNDILDPDLDALARAVVRLVLFAAYVTGLGRALLSVRRPSWRLPALSDRAAQRLRPFPWLLGAAALLFGLIERISRTIGSSLPATVATRGLMALVISGLIGAAWLRLRRARPEQVAGAAVEPRPLWIGLLGAVAVLGVLVSWLGVATGYIALAFFVAVQMLWIGVIVASAYLLFHLLNDLIHTLLSPRGRGGQRLLATFDWPPHALDQAATLLAGASRVLLTVLALAIVLTPFGAGPGDLLASARRSFSGLKLGDLPIDPGSIFSALLVLLAGVFLLRMIKRWLREQLLPKSTMEPGMQDSIVTLLGYLGGLLVMVLTLAALHVNLTSITWIVSALSVGIGFGLQAIVQNFISGLILLVERPVKVGDWVSLGTVEGDIRRINVRATEIQLWDRSTVIVPNSQLITENVRNVTQPNALGRVHIKLPMPLDTDPGKVRSLVLDVLNAHPGTLATPAPYVQLANLDDGAMTFNCVAYVNSPRDANGVKSELLFETLERLRAARLPLIRTQLVRTLPPVAENDEHTG